MLRAKILLGQTYFFEESENKELALKARNIFDEVLKEAESSNNKLYIGRALRNIGNTFWDFDKKISNDYYLSAFEISKDITDNTGMIKSLSNIGNYHHKQCEYEKAMSYYLQALRISEDIDDKEEIFWQYWKIAGIDIRSGDYETGLSKINQIINFINKTKVLIKYKYNCLKNKGKVYFSVGKYNQSLKYYKQSYIECQNNNNKHQMTHRCIDIANCYYQLGEYTNSIKYIRKVHSQEIDGSDWLNGHLILSLINKKQGKDIDEKIIDSFIKIDENDTEYFDNYAIYQIIKDKSYLEIANKQIQERLKQITKKFKAKFLSYPIPKAIVEEWEKVK